MSRQDSDTMNDTLRAFRTGGARKGRNRFTVIHDTEPVYIDPETGERTTGRDAVNRVMRAAVGRYPAHDEPEAS